MIIATQGTTMEIVGLFMVCFSITLGYGDTSSSESEVYISLMVSSAPTSNTLEVISAVNTTVENINGDPNILPTLILQYGIRDTKVWFDFFKTISIALYSM